jgi:deoxycytidylate deaminase
MLTASVQENVVRLANNLFELTKNCHWKHYSFIVRCNTVYSIGWNQPYKTHPLAKRFGYKFHCIHSELHSILKFNEPVVKLCKYTLVNVRLNKDRVVRLSKPCEVCQRLLVAFPFSEVWYSTNSSSFERLY